MTFAELYAWLLSIALALPLPWYAQPPEIPKERAERVGTIVEAIAIETFDPPALWPWPHEDLALAVLVVTWSESGRWRRDVHNGTTLGDEGRARCLAQLHASGDFVSHAEWLASTGVDLASTRVCVRVAARILAFHARRCRAGREPSATRLAGILAAYGSGYACRATWSEPRRRAELWARLRAMPVVVLQ